MDSHANPPTDRPLATVALAAPPVVDGSFDERLSDLGDLKRLEAAHRTTLAWCLERKNFLVCANNLWREDDHNAGFRAARGLAQLLADEAAAEPDTGRKQALQKRAKAALRLTSITSKGNALKGMPGIVVREERFDHPVRTRGLLHCANRVVVDLRTGAVRPSVPNDYFMKITGAAYVPGAPAPHFAQFLLSSFAGDVEVIDYLQRLVGMTALGDPKERVLIFSNGGGTNGKGTFDKAISRTLGTYAQATSPAVLMTKHHGGGPSPELMRLKGVRAAFASESREGDTLDTAVVKRLSGNDTITARPLYGGEIEIAPTWPIWLATNTLPCITDTTHSIWTRVKVINWPVQFLTPAEAARLRPQPALGEKPLPLIDKELEDKLAAEVDGILQWIIEGAQKYLADGLREPESVRRAGLQYRQEQDSVAAWVDTCCILNPSDSTPYAVLRTSYVAYCRGENIMALGRGRFIVALGGFGMAKTRGTGGMRKYSGVRLPTEYE